MTRPKPNKLDTPLSQKEQQQTKQTARHGNDPSIYLESIFGVNIFGSTFWVHMHAWGIEPQYVHQHRKRKQSNAKAKC